MEDKTTGDLKRELMDNAEIDSYIKENAALFVDMTVIELPGAVHRHHHAAV